MNFSWTFIAITVSCAIWVMITPVFSPLYIWFLLCLLWLTDLLLTIRSPKLVIRRIYPEPIYQNQKALIELKLFNPLRHNLKVYVKDDAPFAVKVVKNTGWLSIPAGQTTSFSYEIFPPKRGSFGFGAINIRLTGRLFLFVQHYAVQTEQTITVYPNLAKINAARLSNLVGTEREEGIHQRKLFGVSGELAQVRDFTTGDDYRKINWKVTAHIGKLVVNDYEPEKDQNVFLFFDTGRLLFDQLNETENRLDYILDSAILLAFNILEHGDMLGALGFNSQIERFLPVGKGKHHLASFINHFFDLEAKLTESDYRSAFRFWQTKNSKRCLVFFYTDFTDWESAKELVGLFKVFSRHHLIVCVLLSQTGLVTIQESVIRDEKSAYLKGTALELAAERELIKHNLVNEGIKVLEVTAGSISGTVVEHYLYLKKKGLF